MQFHSVVIAEPVANLAGLIGGLASYQIFHLVGAAQSTEVAAAVATAALVNVALGAKINLFMLDLLSLVVVRPISALSCAAIVDLVVKASMAHPS